MYRCNDCGAIFDDPQAVEEDRGEFWEMPCTETMYYCPCCESEDFDVYDPDDDDIDEEAEYERWERER